MNMMSKSAQLFVMAGVAALVLTGCSSSRFGPSRITTRTPETLQPVASSNVQSSNLPPLGSTDTTVASNDPTVFGNNTTTFGNSGDPALLGQTQNPDGSFASVDGVGALPNTSGRDLSGGLTVTKLLGTWTVVAGADQCRLNLTQTTKSGTNRYRASTQTCNVPALSLVTSWRLAGSQVQLYDESGAIVGSLLASGNRFVGTLSGGIAVSMVG